VNTAHLFLGTAEDNNRDRHLKGHTVIPDARGMRHGMSKLTDPDVLAIRDRCNAGERRATIAADFGINPSVISKIHARKAWSHI